MKVLVKRSLTGIAFAAIMLAGILIHQYIFATVFAIFLMFTLFEFYKISENIGYEPSVKIGLICSFLLFVIFFLAASHVIPKEYIYLSILIPLFTLLPDLFDKRKNGFKNSMITIAGIIYIALPYSLLSFLIYPGNDSGSQFYPWVLMGIFFIIWIYDSMAYVFGSMLGKHKICVRISPKKSWEGLIGGTVFAVITGIVNSLFFDELSLINWVVVALLIVAFGTSGDFFESKLKREAGVKDSGNILPGHGGMLDRFDTMLFAAPVIFVWITLFGNI
ncbi:MAG TPA: phosphatidate cytidylyltransferase [Bacteroidia bacterium]|nr:phosphatidate cytidylyltransferase [Bacteroidia bacterium]